MDEPAPVTRQQLIERVDLQQLVAETEGQGKRSGKVRMYYTPPWRATHRKSRSLAVYTDGFKDYSTGESGNAISWVERAYNLSRPDAITWLQNWLGGSAAPIRSRAAPAPETSASEPPPGDWQAAAREAVEIAERYLWSDRPDARRARAYLHDLRGLTDDTIRAFHLGYNPGWRRLSYKDADGKPISLPPGIVIPYLEGGALWAVRVRSRVGNLAEALGIRPDHNRDGDELSKYLNLSGSKVNGPIFNGDALRQRPGSDVLIVEGEFDAMLAQQGLGEAVTVVTLGPASSRLTKRGRDLFKAAGRIYATLDNDEAGHKAAARLIKALPKPPVALALPVGKDVTEYMVGQGGDLAAWWQRRAGVTKGEIIEPTAEPLAQLRHFAGGVPDSWRSAVLRLQRRDTAALVLELVNEAIRANLLDTDRFTFADLLRANLALGWGITESTLRKGLKSGLEVFFCILETSKETEEIVSKTQNNSAAGRHAEVYRLNSQADAKRALLELAAPGLNQRAFPARSDPERNVTAVPATISARMLETLVDPAEAQQIADELNALRTPAYEQTGDERRKAGKKARWLYNRLAAALEDMTSTPLPEGWTPHDLPSYRAAFLRGWMSADPDRLQCSRAQIMRLIGISNGSVDTYRARAGITVTSPPEGEFERRPLPDVPNVEKAVRQIGYEVKGRPMQIVACAADGREVARAYSSETAHEFADAQRAAGAQVFVEYQVANWHAVDPKATPESSASARRATPEPTEKTSDRSPASPPTDEPRQTDGYSSAWVKAQLELGLRLMGWQTDAGRFMNPDTGEVASFDASATDLIELMLGRAVRGTEGEEFDLLLETGKALGATVRTLA